MKIYQQGTPDTNIRYFKCPRCKCIWEADASEYEYAFTNTNDEQYYCKCPMDFCNAYGNEISHKDIK